MTDAPFEVAGENPWRTRATRVIYDNGRLRLREDVVVQPDGRPGSYVYVDVPLPVVAVVPVDDRQHVHLVRQWRYPWGANSWEIPAGQATAEEDLLAAARRELAEEVGLQAARWEPLGTGYGSASVTARVHLFLARGLTPAPDGFQRDGSEADLICATAPLEAAVEAAMDGRMQHLISAMGVVRAARRLAAEH